MTNPANTPPDNSKSGFAKVGSSILAAGLSGYFVNWLSLHGVNFTEFGVSSEIVKASLEGTLVGFFVWMTPQNLVDEIVVFIKFCKSSWKQISGAVDQ